MSEVSEELLSAMIASSAAPAGFRAAIAAESAADPGNEPDARPFLVLAELVSTWPRNTTIPANTLSVNQATRLLSLGSIIDPS